MTILQRLKERKKELTKEQKDIRKWDMTPEQKKIQRLIGSHRIDELDYITILLKEEKIIPYTKKDKSFVVYYGGEKNRK